MLSWVLLYLLAVRTVCAAVRECGLVHVSGVLVAVVLVVVVVRILVVVVCDGVM